MLKKMKKLRNWSLKGPPDLSPPTIVERRRAVVGRRLLSSPVASIAAAKAAALFLVWCDASLLFPPQSAVIPCPIYRLEASSRC
ncbi:unnamed protein product [Cuscuta campestris]|uniref:Uncharacterized protein n=1 Tax=Cuscuta campestris TaxID=132261 RepID=A0A484MQS1_9ASTE|nr:unnamed protein product [Cuscuta campestris]